jgi:hypothetical protein
MKDRSFFTELKRRNAYKLAFLLCLAERNRLPVLRSPAGPYLGAGS